MSQTDPFPVVKEEVKQSMSVVRALYERWQQLAKSSQGDAEELEWTRSNLLSKLEEIQWDLKDLDKVITTLEQRGDARIGAPELAARRRFVVESQEQLARLEQDVQDPRWERAQRERQELFRPEKSDERSRVDNSAFNQGFIDDQMQQQQQIIREQDEDLEDLSHAVTKLGDYGKIIHTELKEQQRMLDELDEDLDRTEGRLQAVMSKVKTMLENSDKGKLCTIFILTIVFILLLVAVIYT